MIFFQTISSDDLPDHLPPIHLPEKLRRAYAAFTQGVQATPTPNQWRQWSADLEAALAALPPLRALKTYGHAVRLAAAPIPSLNNCVRNTAYYSVLSVRRPHSTWVIRVPHQEYTWRWSVRWIAIVIAILMNKIIHLIRLTSFRSQTVER